MTALKMANPGPGQFESVVKFLNGMESIIEHGIYPNDETGETESELGDRAATDWIEAAIQAAIDNAKLVPDLRRMVELQDNLLACYRMGRQVEEKVLVEIRELRERLAK